VVTLLEGLDCGLACAENLQACGRCLGLPRLVIAERVRACRTGRPGTASTTHVALDDIVLAEMPWAGCKALMSATAIALALVALGISRAPTLLAALAQLFLVGLDFAAVALVFDAPAQGL
jgi:hypothetical protein